MSEELSADVDALGQGVFLSARKAETSSRWRFDLGRIPRLRRFSACHRYEPFWMQPCAGTGLAEVPPETQFLLAELDDGRFVFLVPLFDELFRFSLQGKKDGTLTLLGETGDSFAPGTGGLALFVTIGEDPFELARLGARSVMARLGTGKLRREKAKPDFVDQFGWCTWDAFYAEVSEAKVRAGLASFRDGGVPPRFLILDDGWQSTARLATGETRLTAFAPNAKFQGDLSGLVRSAKDEFGVRTLLVWHALGGYWGGAEHAAFSSYGVVEQTRQFGEGILFHVPTFNQDWWGSVFGLVPADTIGRFYDDYHSTLRAQGVDGVKVDNQATLEAVAQRQGGRVQLTRAYRAALESSVTKHFSGRLINCMSNAQETWYGSRDSTLMRSSIDFFPQRPDSHGRHLYTNAQVGLWFGEFMHPDWDMFQSGHEWGAFHAAGRAVSGGPIYVSDKPGAQDFALLKKLVCSDGSVLLCDGVGLPTRDVLCHDPTREPVLLKVWNRAGNAAVIGAFNAQIGADGAPGPVLRGAAGPGDVPRFEGETFACYRHVAGTLSALERDGRVALELGERGYEVVTLVPIENGFAAVGLTDKLNSAAALSRVSFPNPQSCELELRDGGDFLAYCAVEPKTVCVAGRPAVFEYDPGSRALRVVSGRNGAHVITVAW